MRNLKRALSLALAAVMVIGMMVVGAGAVSYNDFTDKDEIVNKDAVSMVTALGIINGLPGGSYGPTQNIDRASFVKMIALTLNGGSEPMLPGDNKVSYVDTKGTWAQQYIEFATNLGIVSGDGTTGKFNPTAPVTISQAAKMLLVALGYNASIEGYVGYDWQMNVDSAANLTHLYDGISGNTSANATRDQAAQLIYNALSATMVKYEYVISGVSATTSQATAKPQITTDGMKTLLEDKFKAIRVTATVLANDYAGLAGKAATDEGKTYMEVTDQPKNNNYQIKNEGVFNVASTPDMLGQSVTMFVKTSGGVTDPSKLTVLGNLILTDDNKVVELTASKSELKDIESFLKDNSLKMDSKSEYYVNYNLKATGKSVVTKNTAGMSITFIDNDDDGVVDYALQMVRTFGKVNSYITSGKGTLYVSAINTSDDVKAYFTGSGKNDDVLPYINSTDAIKEIKGFDTVKKDQYVFFYGVAGTAYVDPAEYVDVTVKSIKGAKVTADGKTYEQSGLVSSVNDASEALSVAVDLGTETRFYLDPAGFVVYTDSAETSNDYLYIEKFDSYSGFRDTVQAKAIFADGSSAIIDVKANGGDITNGTGTTKTAYAFTKSSKDVYTLTNPDNLNNTATVSNIDKVEKGKANLKNSSGTTLALANDGTIFVVARTSGNWSVYEGIANVPSLSSGNGKNFTASAVVKNGVAKIVFVSESDIGGSKEGVYVLNVNPTISGSKDDKVYTYDVIYKGEKMELTGDSAALFTANGNNKKAGYFENVEVNGKEITDVPTGAMPLVPEYVKSVEKGVIRTMATNVADGSDKTVMTFDKDTIFVIVDGSDVATVDSNAIVVAPGFDSNDTLVLADKDSDGVADYVFICR
ncbi:hypothetical protein CE91St41_05910 [Oscillospiraceae bacterium]|nr:hypothetical protein CE91St40_05910 [Oscillospiraceae bacterium]BDF73702.1 hypothetical protein CE91St41_05910 [Oscillospiraceae bacterium]